MEKNKPVRTLWHGNVKVSIWLNPTQNGAIYSISCARIYTDKHGKIRDAYTFSDVESLRLHALLPEADTVLRQLKQEYNSRSKGQAHQPVMQEATPQQAMQQAASPDPKGYVGRGQYSPNQR